MIEFSANYYDGVSSRERDVSVWLEQDNLHLRDLDVPRSYPLSVVRIAPRVGSTFRALLLPGGARLVTYDRRIVDELERRQGVPRLTAVLRRLEDNAAFVAMLAVVLAAVLVVAAFRALPALAERALSLVPLTTGAVASGDAQRPARAALIGGHAARAHADRAAGGFREPIERRLLDRDGGAPALVAPRDHAALVALAAERAAAQVEAHLAHDPAELEGS